MSNRPRAIRVPTIAISTADVSVAKIYSAMAPETAREVKVVLQLQRRADSRWASWLPRRLMPGASALARSSRPPR
jgi:hypothetical protein